MTTSLYAVDPVLPAEAVGQNRRAAARLVIVADPEHGDVKVRWVLGREQPYRCALCGPLTAATCRHTFAAALLLAEKLLGLTRVPELHPNEHQEKGTT